MARLSLGLFLVGVLASACGGEAPDEAWDDDLATAESEATAVRPKSSGTLAIGESKELTLGGTTPQGFTFTLAHARRVSLRADAVSPSVALSLKVYGPVTGPRLPTKALYESRPGEANAFEGRALPGPGTYLVAAACAGSRCRGKKVRISAGWGQEPDLGATITFQRTGARETITGALARGRGVLVVFDATRFDLNQMNVNEADPGCRMAPVLHYRQRAGEPFTEYVPESDGPGPYLRDRLTAVFPVRADADRLELYFRASQVGRACANPNPQTWDSNGGANWVFPVADAVVRFPDDLSWPQLHGTLSSGASVAVDYPLARMYRLLPCRPAYAGHNITTVTLWWRWDAGAWQSFVVARPATMGQPQAGGPFSPQLRVPAGARRLETYLHGQAGCQAWDSNYGANFTFEVR